MRRRRASGCGQHAGSAKQTELARADKRLGKFFALALALCAAAPLAAFAADLPAPGLPPVYKEPPILYNWTGFYIGGNLGAAWGGLSGGNFSDTLGSSFTSATNYQFLGGGQIGVNYQFGSVVVGAEAMFDWLADNQTNPVTATDPTGAVAANIAAVNARWLTTTTGRLGYAWDRVLLYAKGGGAWVAMTSPTIAVSGAPASFAGVTNNTSFGYTAGLGLEWAFAGNWSVRAEYDYIGLPNQTFTVAAGTPTFGGDVITFAKRNISIATGAINYKFGGW
jgi:outer membrane immunogenic protein